MDTDPKKTTEPSTPALKIEPLFPAVDTKVIDVFSSSIAQVTELDSDEARLDFEAILKDAEQVTKTLDKEAEKFTAPLKEKLAAIEAEKKRLGSTLSAQVARGKALVNTFVKEAFKRAELERKRLAEIAATELANAKGSLEETAKAEEAANLAIDSIQAPTKGVMLKTTYEVVDLSKVPRQFLELNAGAVREYMKGKDINSMQIEGIEFSKEPIRSGR